MTSRAGDPREPIAPCPACGAARAEPDACDRCGAVYGDRHRCPHCGGITRAELAGVKGWVCAACRGPRMRVGRDAELDGHLRDVQKSWSRMGPLAVGRAVLWIVAVLGALVAAEWIGVVGFGVASALAFAIWIAGAAVGALSLSRRRAKLERDANAALMQARARAAEVALRETGGALTADELAKKLGSDAAAAEVVLNTLATSDRVRIDVGDDARVRYSMEPVLEARSPDDDETAPLSDEHRRRDRDVR